MTRTNGGADVQTKAMGGDATLGFTGTSGTATATTLPDTGAPGWAVSQWVGHIVVSGVSAVFGVVIANTASVLTIDYWHVPGTDAVGTTPAAAAIYVILPGQAPAWYIGLTAATRTIAGADTYLTNDGATVAELWASGGGLNRARAAWTHTAGVGSYTLTKQFTSNSNDGSPVTVHRIGVFNCQVTAAPTTTTSGPMLFETNLTNDAVLVPSAGDQVTITEAVSV